MSAGDPWRDPERQRWLLGLEAVLGVDHLFREYLGYHLNPADQETLLTGPGRHVMAAISGSAGPLQALWDSDVRDILFAESIGDAVAGLALAHARVLHEGGGPVDVDMAWSWAAAIEHSGRQVAGSMLQDFLFTTVRLALADPPPLLRDLVAGPATAPDRLRAARNAIATVRAALARHHSPPTTSAPPVVRARFFDRQWRDLVRSFPDDVS